jgi:hypothetical protein
MTMVLYGSVRGYVCLGTRLLEKQFYVKLLSQLIPYIPGVPKIYLDLKEKYWWYGLKRDIAEYVALCDTC